MARLVSSLREHWNMGEGWCDRDRDRDRPFTVRLSAEVDLEVLRVVQHVQEGTALVKLGNAEEN